MHLLPRCVQSEKNAQTSIDSAAMSRGILRYTIIKKYFHGEEVQVYFAVSTVR